ncbi:AMP-binding protein [Actinomadura rugatobispora]|uniref:AMP-binding protein n=1 Tax=Actinomadura rugatobispora TaxID=1994 RepID=A0ABW1AAJ1_9ACTN|nr:acyl-CoA synthetase [Actinomadura rugatobispora]
MTRIEIAGITAEDTDLALTDGVSGLTWGRLLDQAVRAGNALRDAAAGGRAAVIGANEVRTLVAHLAAALAGVSSVAVNARLRPQEVEYILRDSGSTVCVVPASRYADLFPVAERAGCRTVVSDVSGATAWQELVESGAPDWDPHAPVEPLVLYTSGTSGFPKGTHSRWAARPEPDVGRHLDSVRAGMAAVPDGPHLVAGPLHHNGPLMGLRSLLMGRPVVILPKFTAEAALAAIERHRIASTVMVPTHLSRMLALPEDLRRRYDVGSVAHLVLTGAPCPQEVKRAFIDWFGPVVSEAYGGSESGTVCMIGSEEWLRKPGSVGRPLPRFDVVVVGDDDRPLPAHRTGRLYFRDRTGHGIEYLGDPEKTAAAHLEPGLFCLGDVGHVDGDGYVFVTDRAVDMVLSGGVNVYPAEAERVLRDHPQVEDAAVIGVPDEDMGESLLALVVPVAGRALDERALDAYCRGFLASYKCPRSYAFVDSVGRDPMGKVQKKRLRQAYLASSAGAPGAVPHA